VVKVVDFKPHALTAVGSNPDRDFGFFMWGSYPASLRNVGGSTQVPVRAWNNAWKGTWGLPPPVKLERPQMTYTVSMWRKTQSNKQNKTKLHFLIVHVFDQIFYDTVVIMLMETIILLLGKATSKF
jgi:hypothetical protein